MKKAYSGLFLLGVLVRLCTNNYATPMLANIRELDHVAEFGDAEHRGERWEVLSTDTSKASDEDTENSETSSSFNSRSSFKTSSSSSEGSSAYTKEREKGKKKKRSCIACPEDMLKSWKNRNIRWICAGYQRARRSFKSTCMMRLRNCQDGTMYVKLYDHKCNNDSYHGRHWFYVYTV